MQQKSEIARSELRKIYKSEKPLEYTAELKYITTLSESELIPCVKLLHEIYMYNLKLLPELVEM